MDNSILALSLIASFSALEVSGPNDLRDAVDALHGAASLRLISPFVARAAVYAIGARVDECRAIFAESDIGAEAFDETVAAIGRFHWDFPKPE
jgi:hypothetical protein